MFKNLARAAAITALGSLTIAGCASRSDEVGAAYTSPVAYQSYSCGELSLKPSGSAAPLPRPRELRIRSTRRMRSPRPPPS